MLNREDGQVLSRIRKWGRLGRYAVVVILVSGLFGCGYGRKPYISNTFADSPGTVGRVTTRIILIGDAGENQAGSLVLSELTKWAEEFNKTDIRDATETIVLFLGDNVYEEGIPEADSGDYEEAKDKLVAQLAALESTGAKGIFVPGNHDWKKSDPRLGPEAVTQQGILVRDQGNILGVDAELLPTNGCPGPEVRSTPAVDIILLDTQWWLFPGDRRPIDCSADEQQVLGKIEAELDSESRFHIIAAHHPLITYGPHGGFFGWRDYLFPLVGRVSKWAWVPLPLIYPIGSRLFPSKEQDLNDALNKKMVGLFADVLSGHDNVIYVAGHDHSLQVFSKAQGADYVLVSGAGSKDKITGVGKRQNTIFAHGEAGFIVLDFLGTNGPVVLTVVEAVGKVYSTTLEFQ